MAPKQVAVENVQVEWERTCDRSAFQRDHERQVDWGKLTQIDLSKVYVVLLTANNRQEVS